MDEVELIELHSGSRTFQYLAAASANIGAFGLGTVVSWTSPALPSLKNDINFEYLKDNKAQASLLGSIVPIGALFSCLITGYLIGKLGRKTTMLLTALPFVIGWLLISSARNFLMLVVGRFITGFCGGTFSLAAPVYIGEIADSKLRGALGSSFQLMLVIGILFVYVLGAFLPWNWLALVCAFIPAIFVICMIFMPESPRYYILKNETSDAAASLMKLRGVDTASSVATELATIQTSAEEASRNQLSLKDIIHPTILKPVSISLSLMFFQQLSGINAVIFYSTSIFNQSGSSMDDNLSTIVVGFVQVVATIASTLLVDRTGRKILLLISDILMGISLVMLGVYFYLKDINDPVYKNIGWLPLLSMVIFIIAFSLGYGPIPWLMVGEILPPRALGIASSIATVFNWFLAFLVTQFFEDLQTSIGAAWCFWMFGIICGIGALYVTFFLPETKGKSLDEIQNFFISLSTPTLNSEHSNPGLLEDES